MIRFLTRRTLSAAVILLLVGAVTFFLFFAMPADPAQLSCGKQCTPELLATIRHNLGTDQPVPVQFWHFLTGVFAGRQIGLQHCNAPCLGYSFVNQQPVLSTLTDRFPATLSLAIGASVLILTAGVGIGVLAALRRGRPTDRIAMATALLGASFQIYFLGIVAQYVFVDQLQWLPQPGYTALTQSPGQWFGGMLLPWLTLATVNAAFYARFARSSMIETLTEDYIRTVRAKGLTPWSIYAKHAWRGAMTPILTLFGMDLGMLLGGALITETVFDIHGLGQLAVQSVSNLDLPMIMGTVLLAAAAVLVMNVVVDACYALIDPRVRTR